MEDVISGHYLFENNNNDGQMKGQTTKTILVEKLVKLCVTLKTGIHCRDQLRVC